PMCDAAWNRHKPATKPARLDVRISGGDRLLVGALVEKGNRLEPIVASPTMPEITGAAFARFHPLRHRDRLAGLRTGMFVGQIGQTGSNHGALPNQVVVVLICLAVVPNAGFAVKRMRQDGCRNFFSHAL